MFTRTKIRHYVTHWRYQAKKKYEHTNGTGGGKPKKMKAWEEAINNLRLNDRDSQRVRLCWTSADCRKTVAWCLKITEKVSFLTL